MVVIVLLVAASGYAVGRISMLEERVTTTTTTSITTTTQGAISYVTITERKTTTITTTLSTDVREPPRTLPPPANSSAIIRGYLLLNGSLFVTLSIDKPVYSLGGGDMHVKGTVTNLTPQDVTIQIENALIWVKNSTGETVWIYPESNAAVLIGPPTRDSLNIGRGETVLINLATADWNLTGVHTVTTKESNIIHVRAVYDEKPLPEGEYTLVWWPRFTLWEGPQTERIEDTVPFTITR
ncbi:MAG: hypothetical protein A3K61_06480 [Thaumarchaeota archaeon RBG_16_49_8]|nr:MAG: hypothetical protein A3K61_06480 [Thaumarchaeota archaeon RBG_16_49_8]